MYKTILIDPPWHERGGGKIKRGADRHYPLVKTIEIPSVIFNSGKFLPCENAHLYLWATNSFLKDSFFVIEALGFRYVTCLTWVKERIGIGQYFRGQTEHLLFSVKGNGMKIRKEHGAPKDISTLISPPPRGIRVHSKKPLEVYDLIEKSSPGPYLEIFARNKRENWDHWGDDVRPEKNGIIGGTMYGQIQLIFAH